MDRPRYSCTFSDTYSSFPSRVRTTMNPGSACRKLWSRADAAAGEPDRSTLFLMKVQIRDMECR